MVPWLVISYTGISDCDGNSKHSQSIFVTIFTKKPWMMYSIESAVILAEVPDLTVIFSPCLAYRETTATLLFEGFLNPVHTP